MTRLRDFFFGPLLLLAAAGWGAIAHAQDSAPLIEISQARYLVAVQSVKSDAQALCVKLNNWLQLESDRLIETNCLSEADPVLRHDRLTAARQSNDYRALMRLDENATGDYRLTIENWQPYDDTGTDFETVAWTVEASKGPEARDLALQMRLKSFLKVEAHPRALREYLLIQGISESQALVLDAKGFYREKATGRELDFEEAYSRFARESRRQKSFLRASFEILTGIGLGAAGYWIVGDHGYDWRDYRMAIRNRMNNIRLDSTAFYINAVGHPMSGYFYYGFARANGYTSLESFLFAFTGSAIWEYFVEANEVLSMNDMVFTPLAGTLIGEVFHQLRHEFMRRPQTRGNRFMTRLFGTPQRLDDFIRKHVITENGMAGSGLSRDVLSKLSLFAEISDSRPGDSNGGQQDLHVGFEAEIFNIPGYLRPGERSRLLMDAPYTRMLLEASFGTQGFNEFELLFQTAWAGYQRQKIEEAGKPGDLRGYSFLVGASTALDLYDLYSGDTRDQLGVINVIGPTIDATLFLRGVRVRMKLDVFGDFAAVRSFAIDDYRAAGNTLQGTKRILRNREYYFAFGMTQRTSLTIERGRWELGGEYALRRYDSIEGNDAEQDILTNDFDLIDRRNSARLWLAYTLPNDRMKLESGIRGDAFYGRADTVEARRSRRTLYTRFRYFF